MTCGRVGSLRDSSVDYLMAVLEDYTLSRIMQYDILALPIAGRKEGWQQLQSLQKQHQ
jgi:hypothetical protein